MLEQPGWEGLVAHRPPPLVLTNRPKREGGFYAGEEASRLDLLRRALVIGADYVDIEWDSIGPLASAPRHPRTRLVVSYHNFTETPSDLPRVYSQLAASGADVVKIACQANDIDDNLHIMRLLRAGTVPTVAMAMGPYGQMSRVLGVSWGSKWVYACLETGAEVAPGQIPACEMREMYRIHEMNAQTRVYGVIGNPVAHSMSPAIHNTAFAALGLNCVYLLCPIDRALEPFVRAFPELQFHGASVTIPHKERIVPLLDEIDPVARKIGAVNTIVRRDGRLYGTNTDWLAAIRGLENAMRDEGEHPLREKRVVVLGAGGSARAIVFGLMERSARVTIVNRTAERAERLAHEARCAWHPRDRMGELRCDVLVNCTSIGMHPHVDQTPFPKEFLREDMAVFDAVYNPLQTRLLKEAAETGCRVVSGLDMFIGQAAEQFRLWTGHPAPIKKMRETVLRRLGCA